MYSFLVPLGVHDLVLYRIKPVTSRVLFETEINPLSQTNQCISGGIPYPQNLVLVCCECGIAPRTFLSIERDLNCQG